MRKSIVIGSDRDLRNWLFEAEEAPVGAAPAGGDKPADEESFDAAILKQAKDIVDTKKVSEVVPKLDKASGAVMDVLKAGLDDKDPADDKVITQDGNPVCSSLFPTQNEISLMKSVGYPLSSFQSLTNIASGDPVGEGLRIIVSGQFIIDGHHRWSSIAAIAGPAGKVLVQDVALPGSTADEKLVKAQIAIAAKVGTPLPKAPGSGEPDNILGAGADAIAQMITNNLSKPTETGAAMLNPEYLKQVIPSSEGRAYFGLKGTETPEQAKQMIIKKVGENLAVLNKPQGEAPPRADMPQFDPKVGGPAFNAVKDELAAGSINIQEPLAEGRLVYGFERRSSLPGIRRRY
jgi:hypothetical protein